MKRALEITVVLTILILAAAGPARKQPAPEETPVVSGKAAEGRRARDRAIENATEKAVEQYIANRVPAALRKKHSDEEQKIVKQAGSLVRSFEIVEETEKEGVLTLRVRVELDKKQIDTRLIKSGLLPSRSLPAVFLFVPCRAGDEEIKSAWQKPKAIARTPNPCEAAISARLAEYGIDTVEAKKESPDLDLEKIMNPRSEEQKREVYRELEEKLGVSALVVGKGILPDYRESKEKTAVLLIAVADLAKERVLWSERMETSAELDGPEDRAPVLKKICGRAGEKALLKIFSGWAPKYMPGEERTIAVDLLGLSSYKAMQEFLDMLHEQAPGVSEAVLIMASPGEVRFGATTTASADSLARWLEGIKSDGGRPRILSQEEDSIRAALVR